MFPFLPERAWAGHIQAGEPDCPDIVDALPFRREVAQLKHD